MLCQYVSVSKLFSLCQNCFCSSQSQQGVLYAYNMILLQNCDDQIFICEQSVEKKPFFLFKIMLIYSKQITQISC